MQNTTDAPETTGSCTLGEAVWTVCLEGAALQLWSSECGVPLAVHNLPTEIDLDCPEQNVWLMQHRDRLLCVVCANAELWWSVVTTRGSAAFGEWRRLLPGDARRAVCAGTWAATIEGHAHIINCNVRQAGRIVELVHRAFSETTGNWPQLGRIHSKTPRPAEGATWYLEAKLTPDGIALQVEIKFDDLTASYSVTRLLGGWPRGGWKGGRWQLVPAGRAVQGEDERPVSASGSQKSSSVVAALEELSRWVDRHEALKRAALLLAAQRSALRDQNRDLSSQNTELTRVVHQLRRKADRVDQQKLRYEAQSRAAIAEQSALESRLRRARERIEELTALKETQREHEEREHEQHETEPVEERSETGLEAVIGRLVRWVRE